MLNCKASLKLRILVVVLVLSATSGMAESQSAAGAHDTMGTLVSTGWLSQHLDDSDLIVLDCTVLMKPDSGGGMRAESGRSHYEKGHIPTAGFADLMGDLSDLDSPLSFVLPTAEEFCAAMGGLGVGDNSRVVLYDAFNSVWAARVWWMLRWVGFDRAALLDGGLKAWKDEGRLLSTEPADHPVRQLTPAPRPELIADRDEVFEAIGDKTVFLVDAMPEPHFQGKMALYDRPGHIPGARNIPAMGLVDESGRYRSQDELTLLFDADRKARSIAYCGAGVAASSDAFVMIRLGFKDVAVYMGSLQEWSADSVNPLAVGER